MFGSRFYSPILHTICPFFCLVVSILQSDRHLLSFNHFLVVTIVVNNFTFPFNQGFVANNIPPIGSDTDLTTIGSNSRNENQSQRKTSSSSSSHSHYHRNSWQHYSSIDSRHKRKSSRQASNDWLNHGTNVEPKHLASQFNWFEYQSDSIPFTPPSESSIRTGFHVSPTEIPPLQILPMGNVTASVGRNAVLECVINRPGQFKVRILLNWFQSINQSIVL